MFKIKNVPMVLFSAFCIKALVTELTLNMVFCISAIGIVSFLYEAFIQNKTLEAFKLEIAAIKKEDEFSKKELEAIKAYVSSLKLNNIRGTSGFNRTAQ